MGKSNFWAQFWVKEDPQNYADKDGKLQPVLGTREMIALGVGTVVGAGIFTMPGIVAADYAGPAVVLSFIIAAVIAGLAALAYSEFASALPFAGSVYTWANVIFGEFVGWIAGWAILAEYVLALALVSASVSAHFQGLLGTMGVELPKQLTAAFSSANGTYFDLFSIIALLIVGHLVSRGMKGAARVENVLVIAKVAAILVFVVVGLTAVQVANWVPFIPAHKAGTSFGGMTGVLAGASQVFFAYLGFDMIAANSAEVKDAQKTMPKAILGTLLIATALFVAVAAVLTGMFHYSDYAGNAEPAAWALKQAGHVLISNVIAAVAVVTLFSGLIGLMIGGSRLVYSFGRDQMLPGVFGKLDKKGLPFNAVTVLTIVGILLGAIFPVGMLANLVSAGTLVAFVIASWGILRLRKRTDIDHSGFKVPFYPVLPVIATIASAGLLLTLSRDAQILIALWIVLGAVVYVLYGRRHSAHHASNKQD
jgi:APA family basic amino acid/polyamine antiporter